MTRGEVWWAELPGDPGYRPVAIVSRAEGMTQRRNVTVAEVTRVIRSLPCEVSLSRADGMPADCVVNTDSLHTIPQARIKGFIMKLSDEQVFALEQALHFSLDLDW